MFHARFACLLVPVFMAMIWSASTFASISSAAPTLTPEEWDRYNHPAKFSKTYEMRFDALPTHGRLDPLHTPWSDSYWPSFEAGISKRWNEPEADRPRGEKDNFFSYRPLSLSELRGKSLEDLKKLSPAEKYDILMGRYDYPTVARERRRTHKGAPKWWGICHGWAPAALNHPEPAATVAINPQGIAVPFGSSDVKALLSYYYAEIADVETAQIGLRCDSPLRLGSACRDVNPGSFHVVLANQIGIRKQGFTAEVDRGKQVWNQPVVEYRTQLLKKLRVRGPVAPGTVELYKVRTDMIYTAEIEPRWEPVIGTDEQNEHVKTYEYTLEIGAQGQILGGEWISRDHPDFFWISSPETFQGYYSGIYQIYRPAMTAF
jgi:hypothetical protein